MKILRIINILLLSTFVLMVAYGLAAAAGTCAYNSCSEGGTTPWTANSSSYADVNYCVNTCASRGDTVIVPAGSASWGSELTITKSIVLQAATAQNGDTTCDAGETCITSTQTATSCTTDCNYMINYVPSSIADDANTLMRITGFVLDANFTAGHINIYNNSTTAHNKVRIDNNSLIDGYYPTSASQTDRNSVMIRGIVYGVMDNNTMGEVPTFRIYGQGVGQYAWQNLPWTPGSASNFFVEDNTFNINAGAHTDWERNIDSTGWGSSWVVRYNDYVTSPATSSLIMIWDSHQGMDSLGTYATRGKEAYGNDFTGMGRFAARCNGGQTLMFYNRDNDTSATYVPFGNMSYLGANEVSLSTCGTNVIWAEQGRASCNNTAMSPQSMPQHPHRNFEWSNWYGSTPTKWSGFRETTSSVMRANLDYFNYATTFTGASGTGCGTLANRPSTCTQGVFYWATDQSCSDISTHVGVSPAAPIAGTGYRCTATDTWQAYYTPYTYPHPLRSPEDTTAPTVSNISPTTQQACNDASDPYTASSHAISFQTSENATCRYTIGTTEDYSDLDTEMTGAGTTSHSGTVALTCGQNSTIYYACTDGTNVSDTASWTFGVSAADDTDAPILSSLTVTNQSCSTTQLLRVQTSEPATCRYCKDDGDACTSATVWDSRTQMTQTVDTQHSEVSISQACSSTETYNILCQDINGNESTNLAVSITTDAAKAMSITVGGAHTITLGTGSLQITVIP